MENLPRVFPEGVSATVHMASWPKPPLFEFIESVMSLETEELYRTLNMGIGMVLVVASENVERIQSLIAEETWVIGTLEDQNGDSSRVILR